MAQFQNSFTEIFLEWPSTKFDKNGSVALNKMAARAKKWKTFKWHLLDQWTDFKIISQKCFLGDPFQKLLKWLCSAKQNGHLSLK